MFQINQTNCVGCHNCRTECPMDAINFVGLKYQIDPDKCVECGLCAKVCHTQSISNTEEPEVIVPHDLIEKEADVVVVGGGSGLVAAVRAAQMGKKVILVEKAKVLGGNTDYAHAFFTVYSKWYEEAGMPDVREDAIKHYLNATNNVLDPGVVRTAVYGTGDFFDWLCEFGTARDYFTLVNLGSLDAHGPIYGPGLTSFISRAFDNLNCRDDSIGPGWGGTYVKYTMLNAIRDQKLPVEILLGTAGAHLEVDDQGAICGIMCEDKGGQVHIKTPTVILQCGGFGKNDDLIREFVPEFFGEGLVQHHRFSVPTDTGDGILMLRELGVEPNPDRMNISQFGPKHHPFNNAIADIALEPEMIQVNLDGKRWVNEEVHLFGMTPIISQQPKAISYSIQSYENIMKIADRFKNNPAMANRKYQFEMITDELNEEATLEVPVKKADTIEELAALCEMPVNVLKETIDHYNKCCANGVDDVFGKSADKLLPIENGPFYAIYGQRFSEACMGGVTVDGDCRVLRNDGSFIPGLYAGGDATSAFHIKGSLAVVSELTWAVASAFTSGANAVDYINKKN